MSLPNRLNRKHKIIIAVLVGAIALTALVYRLAYFESARERILKLIGAKEAVVIKGDSQVIVNRDLLLNYYNLFGFTEPWTEPDTTTERYRAMLLQMLNYADSLGLDRHHYHDDFIRSYDSLVLSPGYNLRNFKTESEIIFADAAISFLHDVAYGREIELAYNGVKYRIDSSRIADMYHYMLNTGDWRSTLDSIEPRISQYVTLKKRLNYMLGFLKSNPMHLTKTTIEAANRADAALRLKFYGCLNDSVSIDSLGNAEWRTALVQFQKMMVSDTTGVLDPKTIALLNEPLLEKVELIKQSLNYWRWTGRLPQREFVLVNIPAASLQIVDEDSARELSMKVILGKSATQTPSFTSYISRVIAYPYWNVPFSIATKEMLPVIKKDVTYLERNSLQVLKGNKEVDPSTINWGALSTKNFPYRIRQATGCDNALGVIKFEINSPFSIYLHDTNRRDLFSRKERFMSHGCIRLEKPFELANYLLEDGMDSTTTAKLDQCLKDEKPTEFKLKKNFPVLILYMMADVDQSGQLRFYKDVYGLQTEKEA